MFWKISLATLSFVVSIAALENYLHAKPLKRVQRVRKLQEQNDVEIVDGVPLWSVLNAGGDVVANRACIRDVSDRPDVLLVGDSIFYGVKLDPTKTLAPLIQQRLTTALGRPTCAVNLSQPGYAFQNENVVIRRAVEDFQPRIVVLEIWANSIHNFALTHDSAYNFGSIELDELGFPNLGVPASLNQKLFSYSAIWRQLSTGFATVKKDGSRYLWESLLTDGLDPLLIWLKERNVSLVLAFPTAMSSPLSEKREKERLFSLVMQWAEYHDLPQIYFLDVMASEKVEDMSIDVCCHLSEQGTEKVAAALEPILLELLSEDRP